jgi:hypothetical protein
MRTVSLPSLVIRRRRFISVESITAFITAASTTLSAAVNWAKTIRSARQAEGVDFLVYGQGLAAEQAAADVTPDFRSHSKLE